jgi:hypothetical protein
MRNITDGREIRYADHHSVMVSSQGKKKGAKGSAHHINPVYGYISTSPRRSEESLSCDSSSGDWHTDTRTSGGRGRRVGSDFEKIILLACRSRASCMKVS